MKVKLPNLLEASKMKNAFLFGAFERIAKALLQKEYFHEIIVGVSDTFILISFPLKGVGIKVDPSDTITLDSITSVILANKHYPVLLNQILDVVNEKDIMYDFPSYFSKEELIFLQEQVKQKSNRLSNTLNKAARQEVPLSVGRKSDLFLEKEKLQVLLQKLKAKTT